MEAATWIEASEKSEKQISSKIALTQADKMDDDSSILLLFRLISF